MTNGEPMSKHLSHEKTIEQQYQVLDDIAHVRHRPGTYMGSIEKRTNVEYIYNGSTFIKEELTYVPGLIKCISEILDNTIDEHKRNPNKLNKVEVTIDKNTKEIIIEDNGGIPVVKHSQFDKYVPEIIFGMLRSGSNYSDADDQQLIGTNGLGSKLTNIMSTDFIVETCDGINKFKQEYKNGMREVSKPIVKPSKKNGTTIQFILDWDYFKTEMNDDLVYKIEKMVIDAAGNNPSCKFILNSKPIQIKSFKDYINLYTNDYVYDENSDWKVAIAPATDGFEHVSFVNSVCTFSKEGGTHIDYVMNQITSELRTFIKKKHKIDVKPSDIKNQMKLFLSCNINRPIFDSQTKERMMSEQKNYKTEWTVNDKFIKKILGSEVVQSILDWAQAKADANERAELRKLNKNIDKANPKKVPNFVDATSKNRAECMLFLAEGISAQNPINNARDSKIMGSFPLRGKPINAYEVDVKKLMDNEEFKNILTITGLQIGVPVESIDQLRFGKIVITSDSDKDGYHIRALLIALFNRFWPELFDLNVISILETPILKLTYKNTSIPFYDQNDYLKWLETNDSKKYSIKYYKGLGTSSTKEFEEYLSPTMLKQNLKIIKKTSECDNIIKMLFSKEKGMADKRKDWLDIYAK